MNSHKLLGMEKRYQVFISSTFVDLKEERKRITQTLMEMDCIPAGMEVFPAIDQEQFDFIKTIIDDSDYYILIIGGRYGSVAPEGISYTEKEYDYAIEKGIKVIAFLHGNVNEIPLGKSEKNPESAKKLEVFRNKVSNGRMIKYWTNPDELPGMVSLSLQKTIKTYPAIGWVRGDNAENPSVYKEINELRKKNENLNDSLEKLRKSSQGKASELADFEETVTLNGRGYDGNIYKSTTYSIDWKLDISWKEIFELLSPYLMTNPVDKKVKETLSDICFAKTKEFDKSLYSEIDDQNFQTVKIHLNALDLVSLVKVKANNGYLLTWELTELGHEIMKKIRSVKKSNSR